MFPKLRHFSRANEIVSTFARYGFGTLLKTSGLTQFLPISDDGGQAPRDLSLPEALRKIAEELGPTFIKAGQIASTRPDLLPSEFIDELRKLQDAASPVDPQIMREVIEEQLGQKPEELFLKFEDQPRASASIGQVHGAVLKDGSRVVLKVQRPGVRQTIINDFEILRAAAVWIDKHSEVGKKYDLPGVAEEFSMTLQNELSYIKEGRNADRLRHNLGSDGSDKAFYIPKVHWDYTTDQVICWEELTGWRIEQIELAEAAGINRYGLAKHFLDNYLQQIFIDGFYHADPHPGNLRIMESGRLGLMDFGMIGHLNRETMENFANLLSSLVEKDSFNLASALLDLAGGSSNEVDFKKFRADVAAYIHNYYSSALNEVQFGKAFNDLIDMGYRHGLRLPGDLSLLSKTMWNIEIIARTLDPSINMIEVLRPFASRLLEQRLLHPHLRWTMVKGLLDWRDLLSELPERSKKLMEKVEEGRFRMELEYRGIDQMSANMVEIGRVLCVSVVSAGGLIGGSIVLSTTKFPDIFHTLGLMLISGALGGVLGIWIWRYVKRLQ